MRAQKRRRTLGPSAAVAFVFCRGRKKLLFLFCRGRAVQMKKQHQLRLVQ